MKILDKNITESDTTFITLEELTNPWQLLVYAKRITQEYPISIGAYIIVGNTHTLRKEYVQAVSAYKTALDLSPFNCVLHYKLALLLWRYSSNIEGALEHFKMAVYLKPDEAKFVYSYAEALLLVGKLEDALFFAKAAVALDPENIAYKDLVYNLLITSQ